MSATKEARVSNRSALEVEWKRYETPEALAREFFGSMGVLPEDVEIEGVDMDGAGYEGITFEQFMGGIKGQGQWGYCHREEGKPAVIHYWHDGRRSAVELARLFGHELGHLQEPFEPEAPEDEADSYEREMAADEYGDIAGQVVALLMREGVLAAKEPRR